MQENLWRCCDKDPLQFWKYTPAETSMMISASVEKHNIEMEIQSTLEARLCAIVLNANGVTKRGKKPFEINDFMPQKKEHFTSEQLEQMAQASVMKMGGEVEYKI